MTTYYTYNAANQLTSGGATYDNNGNMTSDGVNSYTWDRANRLLSMGGASYQYDGEGRRVQQTVSSTVTKYLLDIQPGLAVVLSETTGVNTMRYVHSPRGIHAHKDASNNWEWMVQDGLGSVREVVDNNVGVLESRNYDPYGNAFGATGTSQTGYGFTGELVDGSGLLDLRARRYNAGMGVFASLDPFEGMRGRAMSLNGYSWVEGNSINRTDPLGLCPANPWSNDLPGQRCVWVANELHQKYNIPLDVLMQKDVVELEGIYALGNYNSTFNESTWSQAVRNNPLEAIGIGVGAGALAIGLAGGLGIGVALGVLTGALAGALSGGVTGQGLGEALYQIAASGQCGCQQQQAVVKMGRDQFVRISRESGAFAGLFYGGALAAGMPGAAAQVGILHGGMTAIDSGADMLSNGVNTCNVISGLLGIAGVLGGVSAINRVNTETGRINQILSIAELTQNRRVYGVINETLSGRGDITSSFTLTPTEALITGDMWLADSYNQIAPGVYRSTIADANGYFHMFRMEDSSLAGAHPPGVPHVHFQLWETVTRADGAITNTEITNNHVPISP